MVIGGIQKFSLLDYPGKTCAALFTVGCNMRCGYCHNPELVLPERYADALPTEDIFTFLEKRRGKLDGVVISGGEPTFHDDLPEFTATVKEMGFLVKLDSNGTKPEMIEQMIKAGTLDYIAMDIKGPIAKYSSISARPINTDAIQRSIKLIMDSGLDYEFRTTVVKSLLTYDDFDQIGEMIKGARRYALQKFVPSKTLNPQFIRETTYDDREFAELKNKMEKYVDLCIVH